MQWKAMKCPTHNEELERIKITQGEKPVIFLGYLFICPLGEWGSRAKEGQDCDYCLDADKEGNPIFETWQQLELTP